MSMVENRKIGIRIRYKDELGYISKIRMRICVL